MNVLKSRSHLSEFWMVFILPWLLDLLAQRQVFTSVFGASLWGLSVAIAVARIRTKDPRFLRSLGLALISVSGVWLLYWAAGFIETPRETHLPSGLPRWLIITHAGLLAAGAGMVVLNFCASMLWLTQNSNLQKTSWERRSLRFSLPNLEALGKVSSGALDLALATWGIGFFLAAINGILKWSDQQWYRDAKVIITAGLWILLAIAFQYGHVSSQNARNRYWAYVVASSIFVVVFMIFIVFGHASSLHEPVNWFVR